MAILHWLVSQSLYIVSTKAYDNLSNARPADDEIAVGGGIAATIFSITLGGLLTIFLPAIAFKRFPGGIPLASSSSRAISAACRRAPDEDRNVALLPLQFGLRRLASEHYPHGRDRMFIGFSSKPVQRLTRRAVVSLDEDDNGLNCTDDCPRIEPLEFDEEGAQSLFPTECMVRALDQ